MLYQLGHGNVASIASQSTPVNYIETFLYILYIKFNLLLRSPWSKVKFVQKSIGEGKFRCSLPVLVGQLFSLCFRGLVVSVRPRYDVIFTSGVETILKKFTSFESRVVFSAEYYCWPDESLMPLYPSSESPYKYLNSGGFIGFASDLLELINSKPISNRDDDQLFYTKIFLDKKLREKHRVRLDTRANIFQNLNGAEGDVKVISDEDEESYVFNTVHASRPSVIHGNGPSKILLNSIGNYVGSPIGWSSKRQSQMAELLHPSPVTLLQQSSVQTAYRGTPTPLAQTGMLFTPHPQGAFGCHHLCEGGPDGVVVSFCDCHAKGPGFNSLRGINGWYNHVSLFEREHGEHLFWLLRKLKDPDVVHLSLLEHHEGMQKGRGRHKVDLLEDRTKLSLELEIISQAQNQDICRISDELVEPGQMYYVSKTSRLDKN
ncbi:hypothetical protein AAG570_004841 [Ranatra chinensis]|uniref:PLOD1-3-like GT domain-containing protein n=1 Tax=Ranatra chinensis TaxID=642074 RepID=A0ABD0XYP4_9HEMI